MDKSKSYSIRLTATDMEKLDEIIKIRSQYLEKYQNYLIIKESWSDIIKTAITRMYNETIEYYMYDKEMYRKEEE